VCVCVCVGLAENYSTLTHAIKKIFTNNPDLRQQVIIGVSNSSSDGVSGAVNHSSYFDNDGDSQLTALRHNIYHYMDIIFSPTPNDISYFLGKGKDKPIEVVQKCGSLKACVHGCDAHDNKKIFEPDLKRYCWIKADPTFNGLKQITYEPEYRVKISDSKPETKPDYFVIERVEYDDKLFQKEPIYFNDKLTCIIGGKSTGKSILIQNLAKALDKEESEKNIEKSNSRTLDVNNLKVFWADGKEEKRKIIYIPQTYLNKLSDEKEEKTEIDKWIHDIILRNPALKLAEEFFLASIKEYKLDLEKDILDLYSIQEDYKNVESQKKEIGDKNGIESEIKKLQLEKDKLTKELNLSEEDIGKYDTAVSEVANNTRKKNALISEKNILSEISTLIEARRLDFSLSDSIMVKINDIQKRMFVELN